MGSKRIGLARTQALLENLKRSLDWNGATLTDVIINTSQATTLGGVLTRLTPQSLVDWNYTDCSAPLVGMSPTLGDGAGVTAAKATYSIMFPNADGGFRAGNMTCIGAQTTTTKYPQLEGDIPATDAGSTASGFNVQLDGESSTNTGMEMHFGSMVKAANSNKFVVGTHAGSIDVTFWTQDWQDYDCVVAGWRKVEAIQTGFGAAIAAETGDGGYSDFFVCGVMGATQQVQSANAINGDTTMQVVDTTDDAVDSDNLQIKMTLRTTGVASLEGLVNNEEAGNGDLAEPSAGTHQVTFDTGDVLVPFIATFKNGAADVEILIKALSISRTPGISTAKL